MTESNHIEYKSKLSGSLEKEVVAFLNYQDGGHLYLGVDDNGQTVGLSDPDGDQLKIKERLKNNIQPSVLGLFDVILEEVDGLSRIKVIIASGSEKPYYIRKQGMSPKGCFLRVGSASEPMTERMIELLFAGRTRNSIGRIVSHRQDLTFRQLKIYYEESGFDLGDQFASNLELQVEDGRYNYAAYLLSDQGGNSVKVAKYAGTDRVDLIESNEYGNCCLVKATKQVLDKLDLENRTATQITSKQRIDQRLYQPVALREAVINAIVHNNYANEVPPKFELFADRLEITSAGGVPTGLSQAEFFKGYSVPRNKELMRIFRDLEMVEHLGSGVPRILRDYSEDAFVFTDNFIRMVFPASVKASGETLPKTLPETLPETLPDGANKTPQRVLEVLSSNPQMTLEEVSVEVGKSVSAIKRAVGRLKLEGKLRHVGSQKGGHWEVLKYESTTPNSTIYFHE
ncbi:MAG: transcriptional regulator [Opitutaceae bacterium BACL24 MAG-120322-bin51]|nr:MAG: transcriptional regulator [Opitutaceae bacterium BACL24 MAG-120322-bin51]